MKNVPDYAKVSRDEYRKLRQQFVSTCDVLGYDFRGTWDIMVGMIEAQHEKVLRGKRHSELTLPEAVSRMREQMRKASMTEQNKTQVATALLKFGLGKS